MSAPNRYWFRLALTVKSELRTRGDVERMTSKTISTGRRRDESPEELKLERDAAGKPFLRGSSLKGAVRAWLDERGGQQSDLVDALFGARKVDNPNAAAAKLEWRDAQMSTPVATRTRSFTAIARQTRSVAARKLRHVEALAPGAVFACTILGRSLADAERDLLVWTIQQLGSDEAGLALGSGTQAGAGRLSIELTELKSLGGESLKAWIRKTGPMSGMPESAATNVPLPQGVPIPAGLTPRSSRRLLVTSLEADILSPILVADPLASRESGDEESERGSRSNAEPVRNSRGRPFIPSSSIQGAFRSHAERILRTIAAPFCVDEASLIRTVACDVGSRRTCDASGRSLTEKGRPRGICLACEAFGSSGWASPVRFSDLEESASKPLTTARQDFVAIDRFDGGVAGGKKFDAEPIVGGGLVGTLSVDLDRCDPWVVGLLVSVLRDLIEGDIHIGGHVNRGYGTASFRIMNVACCHGSDDEFKQLAREFGVILGLSNNERMRCDASSTSRVKDAFDSLVSRIKAAAARRPEDAP